MKKLLLTLLLLPMMAVAQVFITPGDTMSDVLTRTLSPNALVFPRPGADGLIAYQALKRGEGEFALATTTTMLIAPVANKGYAINPLNEFDVVTVLAGSPFVLTTQKGKYKSIDEVLAPGKKVSLGGFGAVSACAVVGNLLREKYGIDLVYVPYKSSSQLASDVSGGFLDISCQTEDVLGTWVASGQWTALAHLGREEIAGVPKLRGMPTIEIQFFLLARKGEHDAGAVVAELNKNRTNFQSTGFKLYLANEPETKKIVQRERELWTREASKLVAP